MTNPTSLKGEKERFRRLLLGISIAIAVGFLMLGLSFYSLLSDQVRVATQRAVVQLLEKHRESFALEIFLHKSGAYKLRVEEIVKDAAGIVQDFAICLYIPKGGEVIASTFVNCPTEDRVPGTRHLANGYAEVIFPLESGQTDDRVIIKVSYRDSGNILAAVCP